MGHTQVKARFGVLAVPDAFRPRRGRRLLPREMSALVQLAYGALLRRDVRKRIMRSLEGNARKIAIAIVYGDGPGVEPHHRASAAQLMDWATRVKARRP